MTGKTSFALLFAATLVFSAGTDARGQEDPVKLMDTSVAYWLDGRQADAVETLKYIIYHSSDTEFTVTAIKELSAILSETGKPEEALPYLVKAEIINPEDPYIQFEKGWNYMALEKCFDARNAFEKASTLTADQGLLNQIRFNLALCERELSGPAKAVDDFQAVYQKYPYLFSPTAYMLSRLYTDMKKREYALNFLKETLRYDPKNIQAEINLARLYEDVDYYVPAWQTYYTLSEIDAQEPFFAEKSEKLAKHVQGNMQNLLYWTRLSWPVHNQPVKPDGKNPVNMALYADRKGNPSLIKRFRFISNSDFSIIDGSLGNVGTGKADSQWSVAYNELNKIYEIRDNTNSIVHSTRRGFTFAPKIPGGVILIKNPELAGARGVNRGDKEIMGDLSVVIKPEGFILLNKTRLENCVAAITASASRDAKSPEDSKALATVIRTRLMKLLISRPHAGSGFDTCDSNHCINFPGLQAESQISVEAADSTRDEVLYNGDALADAEFHTACGGFTESGADDHGNYPRKLTPYSLRAWTFRAPGDELLCLPYDKLYASDVYWTLLLEPKWIEDRLNRLYKIGYIKTLTTVKRTKYGKVESIKAEGTAGSAIIEGFDNISYLLGADTLRSPLFTIGQLNKGKYPEFFILRGIGTGHGRGYCIMGGNGMAKSGYKHEDILKHYFPGLKVKKLPGKNRY